jgi:hypothetical protein
MKKIILLVLFSTAIDAFAQYPLAPEVWSSPEKIAVISEWAGRNQCPSISWDKQKLYFDGLAVSEWADTGWTIPQLLPNHINQHLATEPTISPNGKRLFFTWFWPTWNIYYSDWDSTINEWGSAINCGPNVNDPYAGGCTLPNDTTLIFLRPGETLISYWDSQLDIWGPAERWPTPYLYFNSDYGIYVSPDFKKVYDTATRSDTTINGEPYLNYDIVVSYKDSTNPMGYKPPKILNFCLYADTQYFAGNYISRGEGWPTLMPDGKKMYFTADYDSQLTIYESTMLIDENGNPVSVNELNSSNSPVDKIELFPAYPNPFNPNTKIKYSLSKSSFVTLKVYDILGNEIETLVSEEKPSGIYEVEFNASNLSSGIYFYQLQASDFISTKKLVLLK